MNPTKYQYTTPHDPVPPQEPIHPHNPDDPYDPYDPNDPNNDVYVDDGTEHIFGYMMISAILLWCFAITFNFTKSICKDCIRDHRIHKKMRVRIIKSENVKRLLNQCSICLEDFDMGDHFILLKCKHGYHEHCIRQWFSERNTTCPLCRENIL